MITPADFGSLLAVAEDDIKQLAVDFMTSYSLSGATPRDQFTENVLKMLEILSGSAYNPHGSFTTGGAKEALDDEAKFLRTNFDLTIRLFRRLAELETGQVNFRWLEKKWATQLRPMLYASGNRMLAANISNGIKAGVHRQNAPPRSYVSGAVRDTAPEVAERIDKLLLSQLPIRRI